MNIAHKFVSWDVPELSTLENSKVYTLRVKLNNGGKLTRPEKNWITENVRGNCYNSTGIPLAGWMFSFKDVLKTFVVKQYGYWHEYNAVDKTSLRAMIHGRIDKINEV